MTGLATAQSSSVLVEALPQISCTSYAEYVTAREGSRRVHFAVNDVGRWRNFKSETRFIQEPSSDLECATAHSMVVLDMHEDLKSSCTQSKESDAPTAGD